MSNDGHNYFFPIHQVPWHDTDDLWDQITRDGKVVSLDIDDTLADFVGHMTNVFGEPVPGVMKNGSLEEMWPGVNWYDVLRDPTHALAMEPFEYAPALADELASRVPFMYLSARPPELTLATAEWLKRHSFVPAPMLCAGSKLKKGLLRTGMFGVIIDDNPSAMKIAREIKAKRYCVARPWNEDEQNRMTVQEIYREVSTLR
jgi:hypothetical protein